MSNITWNHTYESSDTNTLTVARAGRTVTVTVTTEDSVASIELPRDAWLELTGQEVK